jgi:hypothetical protein
MEREPDRLAVARQSLIADPAKRSPFLFAVDLHLLDPVAQGLGPDPELTRHPHDCAEAPARVLVRFDVTIQPLLSQRMEDLSNLNVRFTIAAPVGSVYSRRVVAIPA